MTRTLECPCLYLVILIGVSRKLITPGHSFTIAVVSRCSVAFRPPIVFTSDGVPFQRTPGAVLYNMGARMRLRHLDVRRGPKTLFFLRNVVDELLYTSGQFYAGPTRRFCEMGCLSCTRSTSSPSECILRNPEVSGSLQIIDPKNVESDKDI